MIVVRVECGYKRETITDTGVAPVISASFWFYSQSCVKRPYKTRHIFEFSDRWLVIAA